jgi:hypothetical protein
MKQIAYGPDDSADSLRLVDAPAPVPGAGEVLIAVDYAGVNRPDLLQFKVELERHDIILRYERNQLFPNLDLVGSYGGRSVRDHFEPAADDVGRFSNPAYSYGVILSFPLANQAARNNYKAAQAVKKQALLQFKKLEQDILAQVETAVTVAQTTFKRLDSTHQARVYSEAAFGAEQTKLANGLSTSFIVLQFQERLTAARSAEIRALADYNRALVQLAFAEGTTLERNQLTVEINNTNDDTIRYFLSKAVSSPKVKEALQKAIRSLEAQRFGLGWDSKDRMQGDRVPTLDEIRERIATPTTDRLYFIRYAMKAGLSIEEIHSLSQIDPLLARTTAPPGL